MVEILLILASLLNNLVPYILGFSFELGKREIWLYHERRDNIETKASVKLTFCLFDVFGL